MYLIGPYIAKHAALSLEEENCVLPPLSLSLSQGGVGPLGPRGDPGLQGLKVSLALG